MRIIQVLLYVIILYKTTHHLLPLLIDLINLFISMRDIHKHQPLDILTLAERRDIHKHQPLDILTLAERALVVNSQCLCMPNGGNAPRIYVDMRARAVLYSVQMCILTCVRMCGITMFLSLCGAKRCYSSFWLWLLQCTLLPKFNLSLPEFVTVVEWRLPCTWG